MGEAKRSQQAGVEQVLRGMHQAGQGVWELHSYHVTALINAAAGIGLNDDVCHDMRVIVGGTAQFQRGETACLLCGARFGAACMPLRFAILRPSIAAIRAIPEHALDVMLIGFCVDCDAKPDLPARMLVYLQQNAITDLRQIELTGNGHA
jgi:hypothetical protein